MIQKELPPPKTRMLPTWKLKDMISRREIQMDAPYQRGIVWEQAKMSELIDSILNNYYIPPLLFAVRKIRGRNTRVVIDGKQRLTSMKRFMKNLIPYIDNSSGKPTERYYADMDDEEEEDDEEEKQIRVRKSDEEEFLTQELLDKFNEYEFVCVEYSEISEDDEFDIFSRVQLGVAITSAEKLKAHNTPIAKLCRQLAEDHKVLLETLPRRGGPARLFQVIAQILFAINNKPENFKGSIKPLTEFVSSNFNPPPDLVDTLKRVMYTLTAIVNDKHHCYVFSERNGLQCTLKSLEILAFSKYISMVQRTRQVKLYATDFTSFRNYLYQERDGKLYLGKEAFLTAMVWIDDQLDKENLRSAYQPRVLQVYDDENKDQLRHEYEPEHLNSSQQKAATKRRREELNHHVPVARRGGKLPTGLRRG